MTWKYGFVLILMLVCNSFAQNNKKAVERLAIWEPPSTVDFPGSVKANIAGEMISNLRVAGESIVLDETELKAVQGHVGGTIGPRGDAGDFLEWVCLRGTGVHGPWVLWPMSGEIHASTLGGFRWQRVERTAHFDPRCQSLPDGRGGIELPIALQLGVVQKEMVRILGEPSKRVGDTLLYLQEHEVTIKDQPFTAMNTLAVVLRGQGVWAIDVWKSTTS